jgi:hypothetical protein
MVRKGSPGLSKLTIILIIVVLVGAVVVLAKFGPPTRQKWEFEDKLTEVLGRLASLEEQGIMDDVAYYCEQNKIPCNPEYDCKLFGEPGQPGRITCNYVVEIHFPLMKKPYLYRLTAVGKRTRIPSSSN